MNNANTQARRGGHDLPREAPASRTSTGTPPVGWVRAAARIAESGRACPYGQLTVVLTCWTGGGAHRSSLRAEPSNPPLCLVLGSELVPVGPGETGLQVTHDAAELA
jgi:hypothetical protein